MPTIVTIREAVKRAKDDGMPISEYSLRQWVKTGAIPVRKVGQKVLLYYPNLISFLQCDDGKDNYPVEIAVVPGIRRIEV